MAKLGILPKPTAFDGHKIAIHPNDKIIVRYLVFALKTLSYSGAHLADGSTEVKLN
jgi:hypothetical protein